MHTQKITYPPNFGPIAIQAAIEYNVTFFSFLQVSAVPEGYQEGAKALTERLNYVNEQIIILLDPTIEHVGELAKWQRRMERCKPSLEKLKLLENATNVDGTFATSIILSLSTVKAVVDAGSAFLDYNRLPV